ncbi:magnesium/cobalt transporter CorA [Kineosporia succinea]
MWEGWVSRHPAEEQNPMDENPRRRRDVEDVIGDCAVYEPGLGRSTRLPMQQAARTARRTDGFVWIGLQNPDPEDVMHVAEEFRLPALAVEDAISAHQRAKLEVYEDLWFMVLRPVRYVDKDEIVDVEEIALFVGRHFLVSVRHGKTDVLTRVRKELDGGKLEASQRGPIAVLHRIADLVVDEYAVVATSIDDDIAEIEQQVFGVREGDHTERIYKLKREVLEFRRAALPLGEPLLRLTQGSVPGMDQDKKARQYFRDVHDHIMRVTDEIERQDSLLSDVLQANVARLSVTQNDVAMRQNEDMRKISAWAAIGLVPTGIAGIYGMNFENMPELTWHYGYYFALSAIAGISVGLWALFKKNDWL